MLVLVGSLLGTNMPAWLEILLDLLAFVGFVVIASRRRSPRKDDKPAATPPAV
jgi:hypothetical protein